VLVPRRRQARSFADLTLDVVEEAGVRVGVAASDMTPWSPAMTVTLAYWAPGTDATVAALVSRSTARSRPHPSLHRVDKLDDLIDSAPRSDPSGCGSDLWGYAPGFSQGIAAPFPPQAGRNAPGCHDYSTP